MLNAKTHRPSVCNAAESLLVHADVAEAFVPRVVAALQDAGVTVHGDETVRPPGRRGPGDRGGPRRGVPLARHLRGRRDPTWRRRSGTSARYSSGHTEAIVTGSQDAARRFTAAVDAAAVMVNASTRFTDGGEFGFGAEIGISTQKLHARGPMGLPEMTSTKYVVTGDGQVR